MPKLNDKMSEDNKNGIIIYQDDNGMTKINVRFSDEDVWLTQQQLAEIYDTTQENISMHISNIFGDNELDQNRTHKKYLLVRQEGGRKVQRNMDHYNLDMIIALGYRVQSQVATRFRRWATERLHEYIQKGFTMDDERLKQGGNRYFRELLQRIRDIRASERNFYQQVTDIYATSIDYDPRDSMTHDFFATVQNKLHYAVHEHTAAEGKLQRLNLLVSQFLDFAEFQALEMKEMRMTDWIEALDNQIIMLQRKLLGGKGQVSHKQAMEKAEKEFNIYRMREMAQLESDFDKMMKELPSKDGKK